jgi:hypothetical protein
VLEGQLIIYFLPFINYLLGFIIYLLVFDFYTMLFLVTDLDDAFFADFSLYLCYEIADFFAD